MLKLGKVLKTSDVLTASADISEEDDYPEEFYEDAYEDVECKHDNFVLVKANLEIMGTKVQICARKTNNCIWKKWRKR